MSKGEKILTVAIVMGFVITATLGGYLSDWTRANNLREETGRIESIRGLAGRTFWEFRKALAILTWVRAQIYFHRGFDYFKHCHEPTTKHIKEESVEETRKLTGTKGSAHIREHVADQEHNHQLVHIHEHDLPPRFHRFILRPYITTHVHDMGALYKMLPWYWLTTKLNPTFARAYANGAYFLIFKLNRREAGMKYLREGLANNPDSYLLHFTLGHIYFSKDHNYGLAIRYFRKALSLKIDEPEDREKIYRYLAFAYELKGDKKNAYKTAKLARELFPKGPSFAQIMKRNMPDYSQRLK